MRALQQWLDRFCYKHPRLGIPGLMRYIVIGNVLVYLLNLFSTNGYPVASALLSFDTSAILQGQVWRIITFIFVPTGSSNIFFFVLTLYFYYFIGSALEREWGSNKFTVFYFFGVILNIILGFFVGTASMYYVNMSMFLAFATLYPNLQFLLFFIIPVKAKWLAWIDAAYFLIAVFQYLFTGHPLLALIPIVAVLNYLLFFAADIGSQFAYWRGQEQGAPAAVQERLPAPRFRAQGGQFPRRQDPDQGPVPPQVCRVRQDRPQRPPDGVPLLLQVQRLLLLLRRPY